MSNQINIKKIKPLSDRILVKPISQEETTASGIVIPDTATKERPEQGEVLAVGPGRINEQTGQRLKMSVKVGQKIMFTKYGPNEIKIGHKEYLIVKEEDVLAVLE